VSKCVTVRHSGMRILSGIERKEDGQCTYNVTLRGVSGKGIIITCSECVFVAKGIQHAMRMRRIILSSVVCPAVPFCASFRKPHDRRKVCCWVSPAVV
jgi:hypothetical protein